ncbi:MULTISPECIES: type II/IV secretion system ATPase subunit [unclassified Archaeoglobus]|jgi:flagellar protein FlaI|uniref:type II/IV secretion system ATPase subunit n=1 Tax=unclassified Archaeoglobus TaxID=2643606 RepID=UPI0025BB0559|nr:MULTISPECIES: type II/IV secretion system ATPase subunit [unclassified Archaeoglobus]
MAAESAKIDFSFKPKGLKQGVVANFPFKPRPLEEEHDHTNMATCGIYKLLPDRMKKEVQKNLHLLEYLHILPLDKIGIPKYVPKLDRKKHGDMDRPNLIYPADEQIYIHVYPDKNDMRNFYIPIEPTLLTGVDELLKEVETRLVDYITDVDFDPEDNEEKIRILKEALREVCEIADKEEENFIENTRAEIRLIPKLKLNFFGRNGKNGFRDKLKVTPQQYKALEYALIRDKVGLGILEPYIRDKYIEDISCSGLGPIFIEHKIFKGLKSVIEFRDEETLNKFIIRLAERIGKPVTYKDPIVDATLPDGSRINIVFGNDISKNGSNFTIRKFNETPFSVLQLIEFGSLDYMIAGYLWLLISEGMSGFICGETASGKTTLLNAITAFIRPEAKIVSIEDTPELQVPHKNWTREVTRGSTRAGGIREGGGTSDVTMFDLLKAALRQRPNYILVGEIRGVEGNIAFQAMQTGHPVMSTFHAATVEKLIQRLTTEPISVPKTFIDNLNFVVIQSAVRRPDGKLVRRVLSVSEIVGYNPQKGGVSFIEVFQWDPVTDTHVFTGYGSSYILEQKIATRLGIPPNKKKLIYEEVEKRAKILKKLDEEGVRDFYEFFKAISKIYKSGLLSIKV